MQYTLKRSRDIQIPFGKAPILYYSPLARVMILLYPNLMRQWCVTHLCTLTEHITFYRTLVLYAHYFQG